MSQSKLLYLVQTLLISGTILVFLRHEARILQLQVITWTVSVVAIMWRYLPNGQLGFYSNDQMQYLSVVRSLMHWNWEGEPPNLFWWTDVAKLPYTASAVPLALLGIHLALALKAVALVCLIALSRDLLERYKCKNFFEQGRVLYLTGCGLIGSFFSIIALRETMMMYCVYKYATNRSLSGKLGLLTAIFLLRAHLAAALLVAEVFLLGWQKVRSHKRKGFWESPLLIVSGVTLGVALFSLRFGGMQGYGFWRSIRTPFTGYFGIAETSQIASNFVGLQFLTSHEAFVRLSISELFIVRLVFSDTVIIPTVFLLTCLLLGHRFAGIHRLTLLSFTIYVAIVTNTDFNSFRQNIPFMPLMGVVILDVLQERKLRRSVEAKPVGAGALVSSS